MTPLVVSFGGGVDSTAMLIEMKNRSIRPDVILFAVGAMIPGSRAMSRPEGVDKTSQPQKSLAQAFRNRNDMKQVHEGAQDGPGRTNGGGDDPEPRGNPEASRAFRR